MNLSPGATPTREAIARDPSLDDQHRDLLLRLYSEMQLASHHGETVGQ